MNEKTTPWFDDIAKVNQERWTNLVQTNVLYSRPYLDLTPETARPVVDAEGIMGDVAGKEVLCLAGGGGQQSIAFALLGANVTVTDLTPAQLEKDRSAADHYGLALTIVQCDMRDLSAFADDSFDIVWHPYSINFVPSVAPVFDEVARVLRPGGLYRMMCMNPFFAAMDEKRWTELGYPVARLYADGEITFTDDHWEFEDSAGTVQRVKGPREFCHTLHTVVDGLVQRKFVILGVWEELTWDDNPEPGTWEHMKAVMPPWFTFWARYQPGGGG